MLSRPATASDIGLVIETVTLAFLRDPVWSVALARPDGSTTHHGSYWRLYVEGALRYSTVFMLEDAAAVSVWIPPRGTDLSEAQEADLEGLVRASLEPAAAEAMFDLYARFAANHPHAEAHAYLSLLATHPTHRGQGLGQRLLGEDLARFDAHGVPAYLESTNPGNDHRYERFGFRRVGGFSAVIDDAPISTMWRAAAGAKPIDFGDDP